VNPAGAVPAHADVCVSNDCGDNTTRRMDVVVTGWMMDLFARGYVAAEKA
jgi:hypothetical protein